MGLILSKQCSEISLYISVTVTLATFVVHPRKGLRTRQGKPNSLLETLCATTYLICFTPLGTGKASVTHREESEMAIGTKEDRLRN